MTEEQLKGFASGIKAEVVCPVTACEIRQGGMRYPEPVHETYFSNSCNMERGYCICLPVDYTPNRKYPVLYMLHGIFGDEYSFTRDHDNRVIEIVSNMASDGLIEDTILVFPNMYATKDPNQKPAFNSEAVAPYDYFETELVNDLMPVIESRYSVKTGRENTYLAGFSMGGRETLYISLCHPELFGYVCSISAAPGLTPGEDFAMKHVGSLSEQEVYYPADVTAPDVLIVCCGTKDSVVGTFPKGYHELMVANGVKHIWFEIPEADHDNHAIQSGIFTLFQKISDNRKF